MPTPVRALVASSSRTFRAPRVGAALLIALLSVLMGVPAGAGALVVPGAPVAIGVIHAPSLTGAAVPHPGVVPTLNATFYTNNTDVGDQTPANQLCNVWFPGTSMCLPQAQNPSLLNLADGDLGVAFSVVSSNTTSTCPGAVGNTTSRIAFATSSDGGLTFTPLQYVGNGGSSTCPYFQGLEPSFAVGPSGTIYGAYVEANATIGQMGGTLFARPILPYYNRPSDALAFLTSADNGTTWSTATALVQGGNISTPQIAVYGQSVYILYENVSNGTSPLTGAGSPPVSLNFLYSSNGGSTWVGPSPIRGYVPGSDPTQLNNTMGPSIAVAPNGTIAIAYTANRSCIAFCASFYATYGNDIVVSTSSTNGTSWKGPLIVARNAGEVSRYFGFAGPGTFQNVPTTSIAFDPLSGALYVAWAQAENISLTDQYAWEYDWQSTGVDTAASTNLGRTWTVASASPPLVSEDFNQQLFGQGYFNPALGVSGGIVYLTYSHYNWTNGATGFFSDDWNLYVDGDNQWASTSPDGISWDRPVLLENSPPALGLNYYSYFGYQASVAFSSPGVPVFAYGLPTGWFSYDYSTRNYNFPVSLGVSTPYTGPTTTLTLAEGGLSPGTLWHATINGNWLDATTPTVQVIVPSGQPFYVGWPGPVVFTGYRAATEALVSLGPRVEISSPTTIDFNFTTFYGITFAIAPGNVPYTTLELFDYSGVDGFSFFYSWQTQIGFGPVYYYQQGVPFPWYLPAGWNLSFGPNGGYPISSYYYTYGFIGYWSGTGNGSYTGSATTAPLSIDSPFNETLWMAATSTYSERFAAPTLPATSAFSFDVDGLTHSGTGGGWVDVANLSTGAHWLSNIDATGATAGWAYFGHADVGNPVILPQDPSVNLSFAYEDLSASPGVVSFHASGVPTGSTWQLSVNGTILSSTTPWINVTTHPGSYPIQAYPVVSANGTSALTPVTPVVVANVSVGSVYDVNFTSAFQLQVLASAGGTVSPSPGNSWLATGASKSFTATASAGFIFLGWTGVGPGSYTGGNASATVTALGPIVETANFAPLAANRFNLTVTESGVPAGTSWTADVGGTAYASSNTTIFVPNVYSCAFSGNLGRYSLAVPYAYANGSSPGTRYVPTNVPTNVCGGSTAAVTFGTQYSVGVSASAGGTVSEFGGVAGGIDQYWVGSTSSITLSEAADPGYTFIGWQGTGAGSYTGTDPAPIIAAGRPVLEVAQFAPIQTSAPPTFTAHFQATAAIQGGAVWTVGINGSVYASTTSWINVSGLLGGTYSASYGGGVNAAGDTEYVVGSPTGNVAVHTNVTVAVQVFTEYWVGVSATGPGLALPASAFVTAGHSIQLNASPQDGATFLGWTGSGTGSYTGADFNHPLTVNAPIHEIAAFALPLAPPATTTSTPGFWNSVDAPIALAVVGLVAGLAVGLILSRRRVPPPAEPVADATTEEGSS
jgi:hypothetical protein